MDIILTAPAGAVNVIVSSFMVTCFMPKDKDDVPDIALDAPSWLESDAKPNRSTASTIIDLTDAYFQRTSSDTQDGRYGSRTPQIRVELPSSIEDDSSSTCYSSENQTNS
ncbi:hypothetical protein EIP86_002180 [Pleurotus ostreatoroseus]|nr:hypothetical protein EIP86_002180 [Pleurotus ostreatoroseus]